MRWISGSQDWRDFSKLAIILHVYTSIVRVFRLAPPFLAPIMPHPARVLHQFQRRRMQRDHVHESSIVASGSVESEQYSPTFQAGRLPEEALDCNPQLLVVDFQGVGLRLQKLKNDPLAVVHFHILRSLASDDSYQAQSLVTMKGWRKVGLPFAAKSAIERSAFWFTDQSKLSLRGKVIVQIMGLIRSDQWLASNFQVPPPPPHLSRRHQSLKLRLAPCEPSKGEI